MSSFFHLAGIIPVASKPTGFKLPWDDCLIPIAPDYFAIDNAIYQAAMAGCETIWLVANESTVPLVRKRVGDYIYDPLSVGTHKRRFAPDKHRRMIAVYYVPIPPGEEHKENCLPWAIIRGALTANDISGAISKWTMPDAFWVSFPFGLWDVNEIREHRKTISSKTPVYLEHEGQTARDGRHLSFSFNQEDLEGYTETFRQLENEMSIPVHSEKEHFTNEIDLGIMFSEERPEEVVSVEPSWFHQITSWDEYRAALGDPRTGQLKSPGKIFLHYKEWNPISEEDNEDLE